MWPTTWKLERLLLLARGQVKGWAWVVAGVPLSKKQIFHTHTHTKAYALSHLCTHSLCKSKQRKKKTSKKKRADDFYLHMLHLQLGTCQHTHAHTHIRKERNITGVWQKQHKSFQCTQILTHIYIHTYMHMGSCLLGQAANASKSKSKLKSRSFARLATNVN